MVSAVPTTDIIRQNPSGRPDPDRDSQWGIAPYVEPRPIADPAPENRATLHAAVTPPDGFERACD